MGNVPKKTAGAALVVQTPEIQPPVSISAQEPVTYRIETHHLSTKLNTPANIEILHKMQDHFHHTTHTTNTSSHDCPHDSSTVTINSTHHKDSAKASRDHSRENKEITESKETNDQHDSVSRKGKFTAKMVGSKTGEVILYPPNFDSNNPEDLQLDESIILHNEAPLTCIRKKETLWSKFMLPPPVPNQRRPMKRVSATILPLQSKLQIHQHVHVDGIGHRKKNSCEFLPPLHPNTSKDLYVPQSMTTIGDIPVRGPRRPQTLTIPKRSSMQQLRLPIPECNENGAMESMTPKELVGQKTETLVVPDVRRTPISSGRGQTMKQKVFQAKFIQHSEELRRQNILAIGSKPDN